MKNASGKPSYLSLGLHCFVPLATPFITLPLSPMLMTHSALPLLFLLKQQPAVLLTHSQVYNLQMISPTDFCS